jgi:hypothetical protein
MRTCRAVFGLPRHRSSSLSDVCLHRAVDEATVPSCGREPRPLGNPDHPERQNIVAGAARQRARILASVPQVCSRPSLTAAAPKSPRGLRAVRSRDRDMRIAPSPARR